MIKKKNNVYQISNQLISEVSHFNQMISLFCHQGGCDAVILSITNKSVLTGDRLKYLKYFIMIFKFSATKMSHFRSNFYKPRPGGSVFLCKNSPCLTPDL